MRKFLCFAFFALGVTSAASQGGPGNGPGPGPGPQPWRVDGSTISYSNGGVTLPASVAGGGKGVGTINVLTYYVAGNPLAFANIAGMISPAQLPFPTTTAKGGVLSSAAPTNQFATGITTGGAVTYAQPIFTNISGSLACSQLPALTGDVANTAGSCASTVTRINGVALGVTTATVGNVLIANGAQWVSTPVTGAFTISGAGVTTIQSSIALPGSPTTTTPIFLDNSTKIPTTAYVQAQIVCTPASAAGFVGDGVTFNDTAFNNWWNTGARCLDFGIGKFAFAAQINKTLAPAPQTVTVTSGAYNSTTGIVSLTTNATLTFPAGSPVTVWNMTGTGAFISAQGTFTSLSVSGSTVTYKIQPSLTMTIAGAGLTGANRGTVTLKGAPGSNLTRLYWPNMSCGISITSGGTDTQFGSFASSFHIRDMTIATGQENCGVGLSLNGYAFGFGTPPTSDIQNVEIQGDDYGAPNEGQQYWTTAISIDCWSNVNVINTNTYGNFVTPQGIGMAYGCSKGTGADPRYAVILNISQSSFNGHLYGLDLLSFWQGVTVNQTNFNSEVGFGTAGIIEFAGNTGVLSGLTVQGSQFGGMDDPINLAPATGSIIFDAQLMNNIIYLINNGVVGIDIGAAGNPAQDIIVSGHALLGDNTKTGTFGIVIDALNGSVVNNVISNTTAAISIGAGSASLVATGNSSRGIIVQQLFNAGCTLCVIADNAGINPIGVTASTTVGTSPATICASSSPETHYFTQSATFTATVKLGTSSGPVVGTMASALAPVVTQLGPNECEVVTWTTTAPTYAKSIH